MTSNDYSVLNLWRVFERHKLLFVKRKPHDDYWCAGAYIINKQKVFNITSQLFHRSEEGDRFLAKVVTGYDRPCHPQMCCENDKFVARAPCVKASRGYAADNLIFSLHDETYMLTIPVMLNSEVGNMSTLHQRHVTFHQPAFHRMMLYTNQMAASPRADVAPLINAQCRFNSSLVSHSQQSKSS